MYFLGIDGGGSQTRAMLCDLSGRIIGHGLSGSSNPRTTQPEALRTHLLVAMSEACESIKLTDIRAAHLGIAGAGEPTTHAAITALAREFLQHERTLISVGHDLATALEGGLAGAPGIALIVGTGSACYGRSADRRCVECGGWGDLVDDVGSGSWIGLRALQACVQQADGRLKQSALMGEVMDFLSIGSMAQFKTRIHDLGLPRHERAPLAQIILDLANSGDEAAQAIVNEAIEALCRLAACVSRQLDIPHPPVLLCGGLTEHPNFRTALSNSLLKIGLNTHRPQLPATTGALMLAFQSAHISIDAAILRELGITYDA
jgi:N-acetylglucosamine kinase-like BadF-type ATPase